MSDEGIEDPRQHDHQQQSDYERLRDQCLSAMNELETLRRRHAEILNRCEMAAQEADYFRKQHKGTLAKLEETTKEQQSSKLQHDQVLIDRDKLRQDYEEIVLLREQEKLESNKPRININHIIKKEELTFDELECENEDLKYNFDDLRSDHDLLLSKHKQLEEDNSLFKEQHDTMMNERDNIAIERNALKQQCAAAIRGYEKALRERDETVREVSQMKQQFDITDRELQQATKVKMQMSKDIMKLRDERNSALGEYKLVMSERDTVHQEIEKLQDDLNRQKVEVKKLVDDKEKVLLEKEGLGHEIVAALADRDQSIKEVHDLRTRLQAAIKEKESSVKHLEDQRQDYQMLKMERNAAKKERGEAIVHRDKILKECFEVKRMFAKMEAGESNETESLKKQFDKLSSELTNAWNIAEVSMTRRDWAFSERDKVVRELEELKEKYYTDKKDKELVEAQYGELFKERDLLQKQCTNLFHELNGYKKVYTTSDGEMKRNLRSSQDSALDSDAPSYHIESIELERASETEDFGFRIDGGSDNPLSSHDSSIFVVEVIKGSMSANKLKLNDCIIHVNTIDMTNIDFQTAFETINSTNYLNITILRHCKTGLKSPIQRFEIKSTEDKNIGLSIDSGLHIKRIEPGSAAAEEETLSIGDKILSVNGQSIENMPYTDAKKLLKTSNLSLTVLKPSVSTTSSHRSLQNNTEDDKLDVHDKQFAENNHHFRSTSAPIYMTTNPAEHLLTSLSHIRSSSVVRGTTEAEYKKIFQELYVEEQNRIREEAAGKDDILTIDERSGQRNNSFMVALKKEIIKPPQATYSSEQLQNKRPMSAYSSKHSSNSSITGSRNSSITGSRFSYDFTRITPSSPLNINRSDPLALSPRTVGQASSASNTSVSSGGRTSHVKRVRKPFHTTGRNSAYAQTSFQDIVHNNNRSTPSRKPVSEIFQTSQTGSFQQYLQSNSPANSLDLRHYGTFPGKPSKINLDLPERHNSHSSVNTSKPSSSTRSVGHYKSCSSHGSLNSSDFSDKAFGKYEPVHEETLESLLEFSRPNQISSARSSGRNSLLNKPVSPTFTLKSKSPKVYRKTPSDEEEEPQPRETVIHKGQYPLGITIAQGQNNGIFVAGVTEESIAASSGLKYGDQLLEYNGINLRMASYEQAALILKQSAVENIVTVLVQYNPHKMHETHTENTSSSHSTPHLSQRILPSSPLSTPRTTPLTKRQIRTAPSTPVSFHGRLNSNTSSSSDHSKLTAAEIKITSIPESDCKEDPRLIRIVRDPSSTPLGIGIIGGNSIGIFISDIQKESLAEVQQGLKCGDQILTYNAKEMNNCTLEEATLELGKPTEVADFNVQYNPPGYIKSQSENGDSFYVRALYDRSHPPRGELAFRKSDVLHVTDTLYKGQLGVWRAYVVDENDGDDYKKTKGKIPSKGKAEQELLLRRSSTYADDKLKGRKSLFRRSKKSSHGYTVNHSRESSDSKTGDIETISNTLSSATSCMFSTEGLFAYQYVKQYDSTYPRPVIIMGGLSEPICDKLIMESPSQFSRCLPEIIETTKDVLEMNLKDGVYLDYKLSRKGDRFECISLQSVKDVVYGKSKHCILDINQDALVRFTSLKLYPIIIFVKYKTPKHVKDMREGHYIRDKISSKVAKDIYDQYSKMEKENKDIFTATLHAHSLNGVCKDIIDCVTEQQKKTLWVNYD